MPRLVLLSEGFTGRAFDLKAEKTTVGRVSDNDFEIPESSVSSHHAEVLLRGNEVVVRDLDSTNGTFIGGERISEAVVKPGQIIRFGTVDLRLESPETAAATASKKPLDQTRVIPQGVKLDDLEGTRTPLDLKGNTAFTKKSNAGTKIFIVVMAVLGVLFFGFLVYMLFLKSP